MKQTTHLSAEKAYQASAYAKLSFREFPKVATIMPHIGAYRVPAFRSEDALGEVDHVAFARMDVD
jgi:hypothetical protein